MTGGFNKREPTNTARIHWHPPIVEIFTRHQWIGFFELLRGYNVDMARKFAMSLISLTRASATAVVKGLLVEITPESISMITRLPRGLKWRKEDNTNNTLANKSFFLEGEELIEDKIGLDGKAFHIPRIRWVTTSSSIFPMKVDIV